MATRMISAIAQCRARCAALNSGTACSMRASISHARFLCSAPAPSLCSAHDHSVQPQAPDQRRGPAGALQARRRRRHARARPLADAGGGLCSRQAGACRHGRGRPRPPARAAAFDEMEKSAPRRLCDAPPRSWSACAPISTSSSPTSQGVVARLANRLQRRLMAQQNRSGISTSRRACSIRRA
jgi:hypothetical protein